MDLHQSEFICIKEEPFNIEIKNETCIDNGTQDKYEEKGDKRLRKRLRKRLCDYTKTFQCTECDYGCTSDTTIINHTYCSGFLTNSQLLDSKRKLRLPNSDTHIWNSPIFVKRNDYDPSKDSRCVGSPDSDADNKYDSDVRTVDDIDDNDEVDIEDDGLEAAEFNDTVTNSIWKPCFVCSMCGVTKTKWLDIKQHTMTHESYHSKYRCTECHFKTDIDSEFEIHKTVHKMEVNLFYSKLVTSTSIQVPIKCSECEYTSSLEYLMDQHMLKHSDENPFKCQHIRCDFIARTPILLTRHMIKHTSNKPFKCKHIGCNFAAKLPNYIKSHMRTHTGKNLFSCPECEFKSTAEIRLNVHMKKYHLDRMVENVITHQEKSRSTEFDPNKDLVMHPRCHNSDSWNKNFQFQESKKDFNSKDILENYKLSHNNHCETNKLESKDDLRNNIQNHVKSHEIISLEDEEFECSLCDYISSSQKDIQEHSSICNGISIF